MNNFISDENYERAAKNGISKNNLDQRVRYLDWEMERATTEPIGKRRNGNYIDPKHVFYVRA